MDKDQLTTALKAEARELGFTLSGVSPAVGPTGLTRFHEWLARGYAGEMHYLPDRAAAYEHPRFVLDGVRSLLMLAMPYQTQGESNAGLNARPTIDGTSSHVQPGQGRVSRYAWGERDYHDVIHDRLKKLARFLRSQVPRVSVRGVVDTAPLLEREFAQRAGLGWVGKHTLLLNRHAGSYFFLAALLTDVELADDEPFAADHCGTCRACLDACPTQAFPEPYVLDATRCISYLTIELRQSIPEALRTGVGDWLFGCDVCQEVCPWNRRSPLSPEIQFAPRTDLDPVELAELFELDDTAFRERFRRTPLWRANRRGLLRNAAIVLGNQRPPAAVSALQRGLHDAEPLVRAACAWALGRYQSDSTRQILLNRLPSEDIAEVLTELRRALDPSPVPYAGVDRYTAESSGEANSGDVS